MRIIADKISTKFFSYDKENKTFSTEASDLPKTFNPESQIYDDACDCGFTLVSEKTGTEALFGFDREDRQEGELMGTWFEYCGIDDTLKGLKILVIND